MKELLRTNDLVRLSWMQALLADAGIESVVLDTHTSVLEGSAGAVPRRMVVDDDDYERARRLMAEAEREIADPRAEPEVDGSDDQASADALTEDRLLDGSVRLLQPAAGYRVAIDPVLLAAAVRPKAGERVLDLGCGTGAAALCLLARCPQAEVIGLERDPDLAQIARQNASLNARGDAFRVVEGDLLDLPAQIRPLSFAHVMANPPYMDPRRARAPAHPGRRSSHLEGGAALVDWVTAALNAVDTRGTITLIHRADRMDEVLAALRDQAGGIEVVPLWPHAGKPAKRVIVRARKNSAAPMSLAAGLLLHRPDGSFTDDADAILRAGAPLPP